MKDDPRKTNTGWDDGWENAVDEGEGFEAFLLGHEDKEFSSERGYHVRDLSYAHLGKGEPGDHYLS